MKIIPYGRQHIDKNDIKSVVDVLNSDYLTQGPKVKEFEIKFAKYTGAKYAISVSNATAGLHLSVMSLGLKKGDRVITTPISFAATANCIRYCGGEVWFADIDPNTYLLSIDSTKKLIESYPKGFFKGIIPVNFGGLPVDLESFRELADLHDLWIIEDSAHSPGAFFYDSNKKLQMSGNGFYSDLSVFSFHPVKHIACGEGGMVTTNSDELFKKISILRTHGITKENLIENHGGWYYEMKMLGFNYRLTDIQSSLGISQLAKNFDGIKKRNEIAQKYIQAFKGSAIKYQNVGFKFYNAYHLFIIEVENRNSLYKFLKKNGILSQIHYIPIHSMPYYKSIGYDDADLKFSENYYKRCISLPMFPTLKSSEQNYIIEKVLNFVSK
tara:strand:+ start:156 stop:1304 length:1149 start_codon:yes stop_codon:yes gene_type:complete